DLRSRDPHLACGYATFLEVLEDRTVLSPTELLPLSARPTQCFELQGTVGAADQSNTGTYACLPGDGSPTAAAPGHPRWGPGSGGPLTELLDGSLPVADGGSDSFGAFVGSSTTHTFTVRNIGATTLTLSSTINLPSGFTLVSGFGSTSLAPGVSTTFTVGVNT